MSACVHRALSACAVAAATLFAAQGVQAGATTDGSMGAVQTLSGTFTVPQTLGTLRGGNLFHSFLRFSIASGESATFSTSDAGVRNVIARVTGGEASLLQGPLALVAAAGAKPDFFLVNPSGITVAKGASFDVPAGLHLSTAPQLRFADGSAWATGSAAPSTLSIAAPESFGFLGARAAAPLLVAESTLAPQGGRGLTLAAGSLTLTGSTLSAADAPLIVVASGSDGMTVPVAAPGVAVMPMPIAGGALQLTDTRLTNSETGAIELRGGALTLTRSELSVDNFSSSAPGGLRLRAAGNLLMANSQLTASALGLAPAGDVELSAGQDLRLGSQSSVFSAGGGNQLRLDAASITLDGALVQTLALDDSITPGRVSVASRGALTMSNGADITVVSFRGSGAAGAADALQVDAASLRLHNSLIGTVSLGPRDAAGLSVRTSGELHLSGSSRIFSSTGGAGSAGTVTVRAGSLKLSGRDDLKADDIFDAATGIVSQSDSFATGQSGSIDLQVSGALELTRQAIISASSAAQGSAGTVTVRAGSLLLDGAGLPGAKGIFSNSNGSLLDAGRVDVRVSGDAHIRRGAGIGADSRFGRGGAVLVEAGSLTLDGAGSHAASTTSISTRALTGFAGDAGQVTVRAAGALAIREGAAISSETESPGGIGGNVIVRAGEATISGAGSGVFAGARPGSSGVVGSVDVATTGALRLGAGGAIGIANEADATPVQGFASALKVQAGTLTMQRAEVTASSVGRIAASSIQLGSSGAFTMSGSSVRTTAVDGDGGPIAVNAIGPMRLIDAQITTSVSGQRNGNGGDIRIAAPSLVMSSSVVQANTRAPLARGGTVVVDTPLLVPDGSHVFVGGSRIREPRLGVPGANVIQAAAPDGIGGTLNLAVPQLDLSAQLAGVSATWIDFGLLALDACLRNERSSFGVAGRGALPARAGDVLRFTTTGEPIAR